MIRMEEAIKWDALCLNQQKMKLDSNIAMNFDVLVMKTL